MAQSLTEQDCAIVRRTTTHASAHCYSSADSMSIKANYSGHWPFTRKLCTLFPAIIHHRWDENINYYTSDFCRMQATTSCHSWAAPNNVWGNAKGKLISNLYLKRENKAGRKKVQLSTIVYGVGHVTHRYGVSVETLNFPFNFAESWSVHTQNRRRPNETFVVCWKKNGKSFAGCSFPRLTATTVTSPAHPSVDLPTSRTNESLVKVTIAFVCTFF